MLIINKCWYDTTSYRRNRLLKCHLTLEEFQDFDYVSRNSDQREISSYTPVKNFFRRGKLREDIFGNLSYFTKYQIVGNDRPDNVALEVYDDEDLDWVVLISNNILNIQSEWPLEQNVFDTFLLREV